MTMRVLRYEVPVDDSPHLVPCGHGPIIHVDCRDPQVVEFWRAVDDEDDDARVFIVIGTGHEVPVGGTVVGTALSPVWIGAHGATARGVLVWHLVELHQAERVNLNPGGARRFA